MNVKTSQLTSKHVKIAQGRGILMCSVFGGSSDVARELCRVLAAEPGQGCRGLQGSSPRSALGTVRAPHGESKSPPGFLLWARALSGVAVSVFGISNRRRRTCGATTGAAGKPQHWVTLRLGGFFKHPLVFHGSKLLPRTAGSGNL